MRFFWLLDNNVGNISLVIFTRAETSTDTTNYDDTIFVHVVYKDYPAVSEKLYVELPIMRSYSLLSIYLRLYRRHCEYFTLRFRGKESKT